MSTSSQDLLSHLRGEGNRLLRSFLEGAIAMAPPAGTARQPSRGRPSAPGWPQGLAATDQAAPTSGQVTVNVNLMGGTVFLDDERRVRALAKEIKRLITEDRRRGLGVGG